MPVVLVGPAPGPEVRTLLGHPEIAAALAAVGEVRMSRAPAGSAEFGAELRAADALLLAGSLPADAVPDRGRLRIVSVPATGYRRYVDEASLARLGIALAHVPRYGDAAVAEHAFALFLALAKNLLPADRAVRAGEWPQPVSLQLDGAVVGVVGLGGTGARMLRLLEAAGARVLVWTRTPDPARLAGTRARYVDLTDLVARSAAISLHLALTAETEGLLTERLLAAARPGTILVNTARAELVEPGVLEAFARSGRLRVAVDVLGEEPPTAPARDAAAGYEVITPHTGYHTPEAARALLLGAIANIADHLAGRPAHLVSPPGAAPPRSAR